MGRMPVLDSLGMHNSGLYSIYPHGRVPKMSLEWSLDLFVPLPNVATLNKFPFFALHINLALLNLFLFFMYEFCLMYVLFPCIHGTFGGQKLVLDLLELELL